MQMLNEDQRKSAVETWKETAFEIEEMFGLVAKTVPSKLMFTSEGTFVAELSPGAIDAGSLLYNSTIDAYQDLLPATTAKLCFQSALPADLLCQECIDDVSFEFARRKIEDGALRNHWESVWSKHTPPRMVSSLVEYHPCVAYIWLYSVAGESGLDTIVRELTHRARHQISLTFDEYMRYFTLRIRRFENTLDETELKIIRHLIENPEIQFNELAKQVGISKEWTTRKLSQLQKRMIIRRFDRVPFSRVRIQMIHILMTAKTDKMTPFSLIKDCPFLFSFSKVLSGDWDSLATLCIPDNQLSMQYLEEGLNLMRTHDLNLHVHRITSSGVSHCFDYYSTKDRQWNLPWELLAIHLQRIQSDNLAESMPKVDTAEKKMETRLDELDIQILDCINKGITSVAKIRENLNVGQNRVAKRLRIMRQVEWRQQSLRLVPILEFFSLSFCIKQLLKRRNITNPSICWVLRILIHKRPF